MKKILIFGAVAVVLVGLPLYSKFMRGTDIEQVEVQAVERKVIKSSILASGTLAFREQVQLRSEVIAQATAVHVEEADEVSKGDLMISLDTESYDAQVDQAAARVRIQEIAIERQKLYIQNLERQFKNASELVGKSLLDEDSYENLKSELSMARVDQESAEEGLLQARAALNQSEDLLAKTQIVSPIDGIVIQVDIKAGETVIAGTTNIPGSTLMVVADPSEMLVEVKVDEADIAMVREGQSTDIFAAAFPDTALIGHVESIATTARQTAGQQSLSFLVKILLVEQDELEVRSGMSARADIYTESSEATLSIPVQAVRYEEAGDNEDEDSDENAYVLLYEDGKAVRREIDAGISSDSDQEILSGVSEGDQVIVGPFRILRSLKNGEAVEVTDPADEDEDEDDQGEED